MNPRPPWLETLLASFPEPPPPDPAGAVARAAVVTARFAAETGETLAARHLRVVALHPVDKMLAEWRTHALAEQVTEPPRTLSPALDAWAAQRRLT